MKNVSSCVLSILLLSGCHEPAPELATEFPDHTLVSLSELGEDVRVSLSGPDVEAGQLLDVEDRADPSLFALLPPQPLRAARTVSELDGAPSDGLTPLCQRSCAQVLFFKEQEMWVEGEVCRKGPILARSGLDFTGVLDRARTYETASSSFPGRFELPEQIHCYPAFFLHRGEIRCDQSCEQCGSGEFACVFYAPTLGALPTELPEGQPSSVGVTDCNPLDKTDCVAEPGGGESPV